MSLCSPVTCPCPQREDFLNFCISESLLKQGEVSREVVFLLCRTKCPENEPPGLSPPPTKSPTSPHPWSALGRCLWAREVSWGTGLSGDSSLLGRGFLKEAPWAGRTLPLVWLDPAGLLLGPGLSCRKISGTDFPETWVVIQRWEPEDLLLKWFGLWSSIHTRYSSGWVSVDGWRWPERRLTASEEAAGKGTGFGGQIDLCLILN